MNGTQKIKDTFAQGKVFTAYLTAGDGGIKRSLEAALALIEGGIHMLELGVPFSDPIADGPVIQRAAARALACHTTLQDVLWLTTEIRKKSAIPLILFSYLNPIYSALNTSFFHEAQRAGIDGILIVDCPIEESASYHKKCLQHNMAPIYVIAPTTPLKRIQAIDKHGRGFLYYACRSGTTGMRDVLPGDFSKKMQLIKSSVHLPVVSGFGIATRKAAKSVLKYADGVVVGSSFVKALEDGMAYTDLKSLAMCINPLMRKR